MNLQHLAEKYNIGLETLQDIIAELARPGLDPRDEIDAPVFKSNVLEIKDVTPGMMLDGVVRNVVDFGAFVDIGLHNDGFIHKSQIGDFFVTHPADHLHVGQQIKAKVIEVDYDKEKISLSMKTEGSTTPLASRSEKDKPTMPKPQTTPVSENSSLKSNINWG